MSWRHQWTCRNIRSILAVPRKGHLSGLRIRMGIILRPPSFLRKDDHVERAAAKGHWKNICHSSRFPEVLLQNLRETGWWHPQGHWKIFCHCLHQGEMGRDGRETSSRVKLV